MKLNKINAEVYEEILNDLTLFINLNPEAVERHFDFTPIHAREGYTKWDNPQLYLDMLDLAKARGIIDVETETVPIVNPYPELFSDDSNPVFNPFSGSTTHYKIRVDRKALNQEIAELESESGKDNRTVVQLYLKDNELCVESEYGKKSVKTYRKGLALHNFVDYIVNKRSGLEITSDDLKRQGLSKSDSLSEMLRKAGFNETLKHYFVPLSTANKIRINTTTKITRSEWNEIANSLNR